MGKRRWIRCCVMKNMTNLLMEIEMKTDRGLNSQILRKSMWKIKDLADHFVEISSQVFGSSRGPTCLYPSLTMPLMRWWMLCWRISSQILIRVSLSSRIVRGETWRCRLNRNIMSHCCSGTHCVGVGSDSGPRISSWYLMTVGCCWPACRDLCPSVDHRWWTMLQEACSQSLPQSLSKPALICEKHSSANCVILWEMAVGLHGARQWAQCTLKEVEPSALVRDIHTSVLLEVILQLWQCTKEQISDLMG